MGCMSWRNFRQRIPQPNTRLIVWIPRLGTWELATLAGHEFTVLSGTNAGTKLHWREVSQYLEVDPPPSLKEKRHG